MRTELSLRRLRVTALGAGVAIALLSPATLWSAPLDPNSQTPAGTNAAQTAPGALPTVKPFPAAYKGSMADRNGDRLSDGLAARLAGMEPNAKLDVIVTFNSPAARTAGRNVTGNIQITREFSRIDGFAATMTAAQARAMAAAAGVFRVEEDATATATLLAARADYGVERIRAETLMDTGTAVSGANVPVCIVDTGVNPRHEQMFNETLGLTKVVGFKDFIGDAGGVIHIDPYDDQGHGTSVANIAAGDGTGPSTLAAPMRGVAPGAPVLSAKVLNYLGSGPDSGVILGVEWCANQPSVRIINLSLTLGSSSDGQDALSLVVNNIVRSGITVVIAAGNSGAELGTIGSPAAASGAITVGASTDYTPTPYDPWYIGGPYTASFSSRGPTADGRAKPDIMAPEVSLTTAFVENIWTGPWPCWEPCYVVISGTSMAAPFVAGTVALMQEAADTVDPALSPNQIREFLYQTAQDRFPGLGKDLETGFGLIDVYAAVNAARGHNAVTPMAFPADMSARASVPDNSEIWIDIDTLESDKPLAVTFVIDGKAGRMGWSPDLDAELYAVNGDGSLALVSASGCPAGPECGSQGRQETLGAPAPLAGTYRMRVFGFEGRPNRGKGGSFTMEISNGRTRAGDPLVSNQTDVPPAALEAHATGDLNTVADAATGTAIVSLDGSGSIGQITAYSWTVTGAAIPDGMFSSVELPIGTHTVTLTVDDGLGGTNATSMAITVCNIECGGGGGGGPPPGKGRNNSNRQLGMR
jgi:serine protease AprX